MKIVVNCCFGAFKLSDAAYEKLISYGVPVRKYIPEYMSSIEPWNGFDEGWVIFDRRLNGYDVASYRRPDNRYWDTSISYDERYRAHPLLVRVIEELGSTASGRDSVLRVIEVPDGIDWCIEDHDGYEHIAEKHRTWRI